MRKYQSIYINTCDRCGYTATFHSENDTEMREANKWKTLGGDTFASLLTHEKSFDLCPKCYDEFQKEFMEWLPPAFRKALGG